jgi:putative hydrolase of the HAD superfamily
LNGDREIPEAIVFDAVGTLICPVEPVPLTYTRIAASHGVRVSAEQVADRFQDAFREIFLNIKERVTGEPLERARWQMLVQRVIGEHPETSDIFEALWEHYSRAESWYVYPDVAKAFARIREERIRMAIASNFDLRLVAICQRLHELDKAEAVFCSSEIGFCKPDIRFFQAIATRMRCHSSRLLMIGDDPELDVSGAIAAGWQAHHLDRRHSDLSRLLHELPGFSA